MNPWGQASTNNIGWGQCANNNIGWGFIVYSTWHGDTNIIGKY